MTQRDRTWSHSDISLPVIAMKGRPRRANRATSIGASSAHLLAPWDGGSASTLTSRPNAAACSARPYVP
jgi:hypothetical protein